MVWNRLWEVHGVSGRQDPDAFYGGGQGIFEVTSKMDRSSGSWDHGLGFYSHRELKGMRKWRKINVSS